MRKQVCRVGLGVLLGLVVSQPAWAATRFAVASGGNPAGNCTGVGANTPCTITQAFSQALTGDTVSLGAGTYNLAATIDVTKRLDIVATDQSAPRPLLETNVSNQLPLKLDTGSDGSTVTHVAFTQLQANSTAVQVIQGAAFADDLITSTATCIDTLSATATVTIDRTTLTQNGSTAGYTCLNPTGVGPVQVTHSTISAPISFGVMLFNGSITD